MSKDAKPLCEEKLKRIKTLEDVVFDDPVTGEKGMLTKVNEMYRMMTQAAGIPFIIKSIILIGSAVAAVKYLFIKDI
jgi:hypothetical protein